MTDLDVVRMGTEVKVDQEMEQEAAMARHMGAVYALFRVSPGVRVMVRSRQ